MGVSLSTHTAHHADHADHADHAHPKTRDEM